VVSCSAISIGYTALAYKGLPAPSTGTQENVSAMPVLYVGRVAGVAVKRGDKLAIALFNKKIYYLVELFKNNGE